MSENSMQPLPDSKGRIARLALTLGLGFLSAFLIFRRLFLLDPEHTLWGDDFDPKLLRWTAEWGYYALGQQFSWTLFWNAQSFFPHLNTLAFSDCLLTLQLVYTPLRWIGVLPLTALYLSLAIFSVLTFSLTTILLQRLKHFDFVETLIIAFASHFSLSMLNFLPHYQLFGFQFAPPFLISLYIFCRELKLRWLILSLSLFVLGSSFAIYLAPTLFCLGLLLGIIVIPRTLLSYPTNKLLKLLIAVVIVSSVFAAGFYGLVVSHYRTMVKQTAVQTFEESAIYSASPQSLFVGRTINSKWYKPAGSNYQKYGDWERAYFPGWLLICGAFLGIVTLLRHSGHKEDQEIRYFSSSIFILGAFTVILSWGPFLEGIKMPFYYLSHILPGLRDMRAPGRFGFIIGLPLSIMLVVGMRAIFRSKPFTRGNQIAALIILVSLMFESMPSYRTFDYVVPYKDVAQKLSEVIEPNTAIVELPAHGSSHFDTIHTILAQLNTALYHHGRIFLGYGGRTTAECQEIIAKSQKLSAGNLGAFEEILAYASSFKVGAVLVHLEKYDSSIKAQFNQATLDKHGFREVYLDENTLIAKAK